MAAAGVARLAGKERNVQSLAEPAAAPPGELDGIGRAEPLFGEINVVSAKEEIVLTTGKLAAAADGHLAAELTGQESANVPFAEVQGPIESQQGAFRRLEHKRLAEPLRLAHRRPAAEEDHREGDQLRPAAVQLGQLLP